VVNLLLASSSRFLLLAALLAEPESTLWSTRSAADAGITYRHDNGLSPRRRLPENMGPGVAIFDYNNDGRMDIAFPTALYRNVDGKRFEDVTTSVGIDTGLFGIGIAVGDPDHDGDRDLVVTTWGEVWFYENLNGKSFSKKSLAPAGLWTAAVFFDADNDGWEDLYLGHFVAYDPKNEPACKYGENFHYCHPLSYPPHPSKLLKNLAGKGWKDVSIESGIAAHPGKAFGAVAADFNLDGRLDLFVANDSVANFLFVNQGNMRFTEQALEANVAYSSDGNPRSGMGVDVADYDNDGRPDLFVSNFNRERFSIYRNLPGKDLNFRDEAAPTGIGNATQMFSGWGVKFLDADHDGLEDILLVNGHPDDRIESLSQTLTFKEPILFFRNTPPRFAASRIGANYPARGLAIGDFDDDGNYDAVIASNGEPPLLLHSKSPNQWLGLNFRDRPTGAHIRWSVSGKIQRKTIHSDASYLSAHDPRVILGLAQARLADWVEIQYPNKAPIRLDKLTAGRYHAVPQR
jgi:hypothetical protein